MDPIALVMKKNPPEKIMHGAIKFIGALIVIMMTILSAMKKVLYKIFLLFKGTLSQEKLFTSGLGVMDWSLDPNH